MKAVIVGAGITGLALAHELLKRGHTVTLVEAAPRPGGELATVEVGGEPVERFYHHLFTHDRFMIDLAEELGVGDRLEWPEPEMGYYLGGRVYPFTSPLDLLRFGALSPWARLRLGLGTVMLQRRRDYRPFEDRTAAEVLPRYVGREAFEAIFASMLRAKFAGHWESVSMAWMWARLMARARTRTPDKRRERLGYFRGSFRVIVDALAESVQERGAEIRLASPVQEITIGEPGAPALRVNDAPVEADAVIATVGSADHPTAIAAVSPRVHGLAGGHGVCGRLRGAAADSRTAFALLLDQHRRPRPALCRPDRAHQLRRP